MHQLWSDIDNRLAVQETRTRIRFSRSSTVLVASSAVTYVADIRTQCIGYGFTLPYREPGSRRRVCTVGSRTGQHVPAATASRRSSRSTTRSECGLMMSWFSSGASMTTTTAQMTATKSRGTTRCFHLSTSRRLTGHHHSLHSVAASLS